MSADEGKEEESLVISLADVIEARRFISSYIHQTPIHTSSYLNQIAGVQVFLKSEMFQKCGVFKARGALNSVLHLSEEQRKQGVITDSSGNHGQALAFACQQFHVPCTVVMPENAPLCKVSAVRGYGANIVRCGNLPSQRLETRDRLAQENNLLAIPSFNYPHVMAGQGTVALELIEQLHDQVDIIVVPIGGGGLSSGVCVAASARMPGIRLIGAEPSGADDAYRSLQAGHIIPQTNPQTAADGLRTSLGSKTFPVLKRHLEKIILVEEEEIRSAMLLLWERCKLMAEPSSAAALAAVLSKEFQSLPGIHKETKVAVILSGGNVDLVQAVSFLFPSKEK